VDAWILGYQKSVKGAAPGVAADAWAMHELEAPEPPPVELRALYSAFDGGLLEGSVRLYRFGQVLEHRNNDALPAWVFGEKGEQRLMAARKATLAAQAGLQLRPGWFEATSADALVFAKRDGRSGAVRVYPSLEQLLAVMVPPAQLEAFGDNTYARAMAVVEDALGNVTASNARALSLKPRKKQQKKKPVVVKKSKSPTPKGRKKSPMAAKKSVKKPAKKAAAKKPAKKVAAKKPAKKAAAKKPAAKKAAAKKPAAKKAAAKKPVAKKAAAKKPVAKAAAKKPAAKKPTAPAAAASFLAPAPAPAPVAEAAPAPASAPAAQ
jgi:hypothetical protein